MFDLACGYTAICLLRPLWSAKGATQAGCRVRLILRGYKDATFTHASFQAETRRCCRWVSLIIKSADLGRARGVLHALIGLKAPFDNSRRNVHAALYVALRACEDN